MLTNAIFIVIGNLLFLFLFWRKLKEDYVANQIFTTAFYALIGGTLGAFVGTRLFPQYWFWTSLILLASGIVFGTKRYRMRIDEVIEAFVIGFLPGYFFLFLAKIISIFSLSILYMSVSAFFLFILYFIFDSHYKKLSWYKSGRIGFSGFTVMGLLFLIRALIALRFENMISFAGSTEIYLSSVISFLSFLRVFDLSRKVN